MIKNGKPKVSKKSGAFAHNPWEDDTDFDSLQIDTLVIDDDFETDLDLASLDTSSDDSELTSFNFIDDTDEPRFNSAGRQENSKLIFENFLQPSSIKNSSSPAKATNSRQGLETNDAFCAQELQSTISPTYQQISDNTKPNLLRSEQSQQTLGKASIAIESGDKNPSIEQLILKDEHFNKIVEQQLHIIHMLQEKLVSLEQTLFLSTQENTDLQDKVKHMEQTLSSFTQENSDLQDRVKHMEQQISAAENLELERSQQLQAATASVQQLELQNNDLQSKLADFAQQKIISEQLIEDVTQQNNVLNRSLELQQNALDSLEAELVKITQVYQDFDKHTTAQYKQNLANLNADIEQQRKEFREEIVALDNTIKQHKQTIIDLEKKLDLSNKQLTAQSHNITELTVHRDKLKSLIGSEQDLRHTIENKLQDALTKLALAEQERQEALNNSKAVEEQAKRAVNNASKMITQLLSSKVIAEQFVAHHSNDIEE